MSRQLRPVVRPYLEKRSDNTENTSACVSGSIFKPFNHSCFVNRPYLIYDNLPFLTLTRAQVPGGAPGVGLAVHLPGLPSLRRTRNREDAAAPPARERSPAGGAVCRASGGHHQTRRVSHPEALLRHTPARVGRRYPHGAGVARAQRRLDDDDLIPRVEPAGPCGAQPGGPVGRPSPRKGKHASKRRSVYTERQAQGYTILARGEAYGL